jgi:hypothetical protein
VGVATQGIGTPEFPCAHRFFSFETGRRVVNETELREKLIDAAAFNAINSAPEVELAPGDVEDHANACKAHAQAACALTEALAYLAPAPGERRLSEPARAALRACLDMRSNELIEHEGGKLALAAVAELEELTRR